MLVPHGKWRCLTRKTSLSAVVSRVYYCQANDSCMTSGRRDPLGLPPHIAPLSCYKVSPSHTHKQDTITDTQCGCPFVWFMGDVVANVASVSFRGSGKLQIFPSQQEVQTWKEEKERWWEAGRSWKEAGILEGNISFTMGLRWEWPALQRRNQPASQGQRWDGIWKQCGQNERPQRCFKGRGFCFWHRTLWLFQVYTFPRSWLFPL